jgi:hypothetical protein
VAVEDVVAKDDNSGESYTVHRHIKRQDYDDLLSLSQISRQVRKEIGAAFWKDISVDIDHWECLFLDFLEDRPAVAPSIKNLCMQWACENEPTDLDNRFIDFCDYISHRLVLDEMTFVLRTSPLVARQIIASERNIEWGRAFRRMNVKTLHVKLFLIDDEDWVNDDGDDDTEDDDERQERLVNEMAPLMAETLRPPVPRAVEITDAEFYLENRGV